MKSWRDIFAIRLKKARKKCNLSQKELALTIGLSDKSISAYEKARVLPPTELLPKFAKILNTTISYFFTDESTISEVKQELLNLNRQIQEMSATIDILTKKLDAHNKETKS